MPFIPVTLQPRAFVWPSPSPAPLLDEDAMRDFTRRISMRDALTIAQMVDYQLRRVGFVRVRTDGRLYLAAEARVVADVVGLDLDLFEIAAAIEDARREAEFAGE